MAADERDRARLLMVWKSGAVFCSGCGELIHLDLKVVTARHHRVHSLDYGHRGCSFHYQPPSISLLTEVNSLLSNTQ